MDNDEIRRPLLDRRNNAPVNHRQDNQNDHLLNTFKERLNIPDQEYSCTYSKKGTVHLIKEDTKHFIKQRTEYACFGYDREANAFYKIKDVQSFLNQADNNAIFAKAISKPGSTKEILKKDHVMCFGPAFTTQQRGGDRFVEKLGSAHVYTALDYIYADDPTYKKNPYTDRALIEQSPNARLHLANAGAQAENAGVAVAQAENAGAQVNRGNARPGWISRMHGLIAGRAGAIDGRSVQTSNSTQRGNGNILD